MEEEDEEGDLQEVRELPWRRGIQGPIIQCEDDGAEGGGGREEKRQKKAVDREIWSARRNMNITMMFVGDNRTHARERNTCT